MSESKILEKETEDAIDLWEIVRPVFARWRIITGLVLISAISSFVYARTLPKIYRSTVTILPASVTSLAAGTAFMFPGMRSVSEIFAVILKSRRMTDAVLDRFNLMAVYEERFHERARTHLASNTKVYVAPEGLISVSIEDTVPQRAADIANFYAANLDAMNREIQVGLSRKRRTFFKEQSQSMARNLGDVDDELGTRLGTLSRDLGVGQQVIGSLLQQYQQAKIEEAKNIPLVQVLDPAVPGELPVKPSVRQKVIIAALFAGIAGAILAYGLERLGSHTAQKP